MRRPVRLTTSGFAISALLASTLATTPSTASAASTGASTRTVPAPATAQANPNDCRSLERLCVWGSTDYYGQFRFYYAKDSFKAQGTCVNLSFPVRSARNMSKYTFYFRSVACGVEEKENHSARLLLSAGTPVDRHADLAFDALSVTRDS
ncbi:hypothetical protein [Actinomadura kijaniata]|uniref:hypothetical protein n=1 Tax=Actinomadura kijaniata TaxID=46161 RepID=UPI00082FAEDE|nr:hypothetical protein [Actinomadura kijaniata]